jgi:hypothetical protein
MSKIANSINKVFANNNWFDKYAISHQLKKYFNFVLAPWEPIQNKQVVCGAKGAKNNNPTRCV